MDADALAEQLLADPGALEQLDEPLTNEVAAVVVARLKAEADRHWWINANRSLEIAELISRIGQQRNDAAQIALGLMARGDALKFLGQTSQAWDALEQAGNLYHAAGDEVGWARTRIGRLAICVDLNRVPQAIKDAHRAEHIFLQHGEQEKLLRLNLNLAIVNGSLGQHQQALERFGAALATAEVLGEAGESHLGLLHTNIGHVHDKLGNLQVARMHHQRAQAIFIERNERRGIALAELNNAHIEMGQGHFRRALHLLHHARELYQSEELSLDAANVTRELIECYLAINRYEEARNLAIEVIAEYQALDASYRQAMALLHLATAEAELSSFDAAQTALDQAELIFASLGAETWTATARLRRGRVSLNRGNLQQAFGDARAAAESFESAGQQVDYARSLLLQGQIALAASDTASAATASATALRVARQQNVPDLRYTTHLLLGQVAEAQGQRLRAQRRYQAATATVERVQRGLTITLRPGFLEDKGGALRALIALHLRHGQGKHAIEALERAKSQTFFGYLADREQLHWAVDDPDNRQLVEELDLLREEHQWLYRLAHRQADDGDAQQSMAPEQAIAKLASRERRMRGITEQLYLSSRDVDRTVHAAHFTQQDLQSSLDEDTLLLEYYDDGTRMWAFSVDSQSLDVHQLPSSVASLNGLLQQLQVNISAALARPGNVSMTQLARRILQRLYATLISPLAQRVAGRRRLIIVPYGALHYLPFHLLESGGEYLIAGHEIVVLPAAGLATRNPPVRAPGARVLAHSWNGRLTKATVEARAVHELFGGELYNESAANRSLLSAPPTQLLHIAAHGEHRLDQPDLSYIELADGQMYTDDLLQNDLSYELVTLSACETGRSRVVAGDELIGLGRGFLYAGAGALITSLWRVSDEMALSLMEQFYHALRAGESKAAALRNAQCTFIDDNPDLHPALWGAFQLVGNAGPLSTFPDAPAVMETAYEKPAVGSR